MSKVDIKKYLLKVEKPARYLGNELNTIHKDEYDFHFCLAFPDLYEVGMSSMAINLLYGILNNENKVFAERVFSVDTDMEDVLRENNLPLFSLESKTALKDFDMIAFSLSYEASYTNVLNILDLSKIEILREKRKEDSPIIAAGGTCCFNPMVMEKFIDMFMIGDGEEVLIEVSNIMKENKNKTKFEKLKLISELEGVYVPSIHKDKIIKKRILKDLAAISYDWTPIVPYIKIVHDRASVEIQRGCTRGCRFCQAGILYRPIREKSLKENLKLIDNALKSSGYSEVSLASLSSSDYSNISELIDELINKYKDKNLSIALPSLRMNKFSVDIAKKVEEGRKTGFTFAPEAGSQRMRDIINKGVTEEEIIETAKEAVKNGWSKLKFYFMIGLPFETIEDVEAIFTLADKVSYECRQISKRIDITVSVSNFVPKAHTPFQWAKQMGMEEMREKHNILRNLFTKRKSLNLKIHEKETSYLEGFLARGDEKIGDLVHLAWKKGAKFDGWKEYKNSGFWLESMQELGIKEEEYLGERDLNTVLPWDFINSGVSKEFYLRELEKAKEAALTEDCRNSCKACGLQNVCKQLNIK